MSGVETPGLGRRIQQRLNGTSVERPNPLLFALYGALLGGVVYTIGAFTWDPPWKVRGMVLFIVAFAICFGGSMYLLALSRWKARDAAPGG